MAMDFDIRYLVVLVTVPDREQGIKISESLVKDGLCACCNVVDGLTSVFMWEGKIEKEGESLMVIKTRAGLFEDLMKRVEQLHPYDVPEVIGLPVVQGNPAYLKWIEEVTRE